jgi:hypothetical protein
MFLSAADDLSEDDADDVQGAGVVMPMAMLSGNGVAEKSLGRVPGADSVPQARQYNERLARARAQNQNRRSVTAASGMVMANTAVGGPMMFSDPQRAPPTMSAAAAAPIDVLSQEVEEMELQEQRQREAAAAYEAQQQAEAARAAQAAQQQAHLQHLQQQQQLQQQAAAAAPPQQFYQTVSSGGGGPAPPSSAGSTSTGYSSSMYSEQPASTAGGPMVPAVPTSPSFGDAPPPPEELERQRQEQAALDAQAAAAAASGGPSKPVALAVASIDTSDLRAFLMRPGPQGAMVQCYIQRRKTGMARIYPTYAPRIARAIRRNSSAQFSPTPYNSLTPYMPSTPPRRYEIYLKEGDQFLLAARKRKKNKSSNYLISLDKDDLARQSGNFFGKLRSNFVGTEFQLYDKGINPEKADEGQKAGASSMVQVRQELGTVSSRDPVSHVTPYLTPRSPRCRSARSSARCSTSRTSSARAGHAR